MLITITKESPTIVEIPGSPMVLQSVERDTLLVEPQRQVLILSQGTQGPPGVSPTGADKHYEHPQPVPAAIWTVTHNLNKKPAVTVLDSAGEQCEGEVQYLSLNVVEITFTAPFSGVAVFN